MTMTGMASAQCNLSQIDDGSQTVSRGLLLAEKGVHVVKAEEFRKASSLMEQSQGRERRLLCLKQQLQASRSHYDIRSTSENKPKTRQQ
jgi:hypothetical protein